MSKVESKIQRDIIQYLRTIDTAYCTNNGGSASSAKGTSDLTVCYKGKYLSLEVKRPDGSYGVTEPQQIRLRQVKRAGGIAAVVTSIADVAALLSSLDNGEYDV